MNKVLITGSSGFLGKKVCEDLIENNFNVIAVGRNKKNNFLNKLTNLETVQVDNIDSNTNWNGILNGVNCIIHCAAKIQNKYDKRNNLSEFREINLFGTVNLAEQAIKAGVKRFIYISSIKVNGEISKINHKFKQKDKVNPQGSYAISKWEAEEYLRKLSYNSNLEIVIIRPPLIYGPNCKGNFKKFISLIKKNVPLPFGLVKNRRSFVSIYNISSLIIICVSHPSASNQTFLVSDDEDISTKDLIIKLKKLLNKKTILFLVPIKILKIFFILFNKKNLIIKIIGNLEVDISYTKKRLNWKPIVNMDYTLKKMLK